MIGNISAGLYGVGVTPSTSSFESIATVTVGSGGSSTVTFSSIPSTYKHLQIRSLNLCSVGADDIRIRFNSDSGSNYRHHYLYGSGSSAVAGGAAATYAAIGLTSLSTTSPTAFVTDILDYTSTSKNKTTRSLCGTDNNGSGYVLLYSGLWFATPAAITQIDISPNSGTFNQYSSFALYGIKD
jgi:hypothetical protein